GNFKQSQILQLENFPTTILTGDMNRDGKVDIGILNETEHGFTVRLNDGDGLFHDEINFSAGKMPTRAQLFQHERKSNYNLAILDQASLRLRLFYNADFKNYFTSEQTYCTGLQPTNVLTFDVDRNGWDDILVGNKQSPHVSLYLNNNGAFNGPIFFQGSIEPKTLQSYQKNESTLVVLTSNPEEKLISVLEIDNRHYSSMSYNLSISESSELLTAYIDDSSQYLNIYNYENSVDGKKSLIVKFEQFASTRFIERTYPLNIKSPALAITGGYFNNDRLLDIAYIAFDTKRKKEEVYQVNNFEKEPANTGWLIQSYDEPIAVRPMMWNADINGDPFTDLIVYFQEPKNILIFYLGRKDSSFSSPRFQLEDVSVIDSREHLRIIDINGDNHNDIIVGSTFKKIIEVYLGKGNGTFYQRTRLSSMENIGGFTLKDIDHDAIPELIMTDEVRGVLKIIRLQN
ncbi:MAG TPA: VCBS repeat-containing protein, partial [Bacteroidota bacterium]|nr:VCBS repeat-containing protein [Bacteroidota bacterium]